MQLECGFGKTLVQWWILQNTVLGSQCLLASICTMTGNPTHGYTARVLGRILPWANIRLSEIFPDLVPPLRAGPFKSLFALFEEPEGGAWKAA